MRLPPNIADSMLYALLRSDYELPVAALTFLPLGNDVASFVYRVDAADGAAYLLKLRTAASWSPASLAIPRFLQQQGVPQIVAPIATRDGALAVPLGGFVASLAPFLEARPVAAVGLALEQWQALGATLRRIHDSRLPPDLAAGVPVERFVPSRRAVLDAVAPIIDGPALPNPIQDELRRVWLDHASTIRLLVARADALGAALRAAPPPSVLCHADFHTWNILVDQLGQPWIVDWDETVVALRERDLMFVIGGIGAGLVTPEQTAAFQAGYGDYALDRRALAYYRYTWAVQDLAAYAEQVLLRPDLPDAARADELAYFKLQLAPGNIVDIALGTDDGES